MTATRLSSTCCWFTSQFGWSITALVCMHACWWVHHVWWKRMASCLLWSKMFFILRNSKILLFYSLQATEVSKVSPLPPKRKLVKEWSETGIQCPKTFSTKVKSTRAPGPTSEDKWEGQWPWLLANPLCKPHLPPHFLQKATKQISK